MTNYRMALALALIVGGCAAATASGNQHGGTIPWFDMNAAKAQRLADAHCRQFGKAIPAGVDFLSIGSVRCLPWCFCASSPQDQKPSAEVACRSDLVCRTERGQLQETKQCAMTETSSREY
jgi:hypothetical protein